MSDLRRVLEDYLSTRENLGYQVGEPGHLLGQFLDHLEANGLDTITTESAVAWAIQPHTTVSAWQARRFGLVRGFATYLHTIDPDSEIPAAGLVTGRNRRAVPYLYSEAEIAALMAAAGQLRSPVRAATYQTLLGLLAVTGLRIGEAIALDRDDVDIAHGQLTVRRGKFGKSRQLPLHATTVNALHEYSQKRNRLLPDPASPAFFVSATGTRLFYSTFHRSFSELITRAGLQPRSATCRPRPHDLRHSFAVRTLLNWYRDDLDAAARLPLLSTWLGHVHPASTYWYLSGAPELFALVADRLEASLGELP